MDQELLLKASFFQKEVEELEGNLEIIDKQLSELEQFSEGMDYLSYNKPKEILSSLGKGVYLRTLPAEGKLFVEAGAGIVVRKTPEEAKKIIESQVKKIREARVRLNAQLEVYYSYLGNIIEKIEKEKS